MSTKPNLVFVFGDQWRAQTFGYAGDTNVKTPRIDQFATESISLKNAVSGVPVCCPYRASLLTGQYPLTHGIIVNDQIIQGKPTSFADALKAGGYHTGYIGKWHIGGRGREACVKNEHRLGFDHWFGHECNHNYNDSYYWDNEENKQKWEGYDAKAQTDAARDYLREQAKSDQPFALFLSWGPPHDPYQTAPEKYRNMYEDATIELRPNVPRGAQQSAREWLKGYYAHCTALDDCFGELLDELDALKLRENTIVVFTSDHGDMLGSHGHKDKQHPHDESILVPFLLRWPEQFGESQRIADDCLNAPDVMPTLLGLMGVPIPETVEGLDFSPALLHGETVGDGAAYLACYRPHHQVRYSDFGRDYRGIRTRRYTYVRDHEGPWLLFDNEADPYQFRNLATYPKYADLVAELDQTLQAKLDQMSDAFETGDELCRRFNVALNAANDIACGRLRPGREEV